MKIGISELIRTGSIAALFLVADGYAQTKPLFVMIEREPVFGAYRADPPLFVLYNDGTVIYWQASKKSLNRVHENEGDYYTALLPDSALAGFKTLLFDTSAISKLGKKYALVNLREPFITQEFAWFYNNGRLQSRYIYGRIEDGFNPKLTELSFLFKITKTIKNFKPQTQQRWLPRKIEVVFGPRTDAFDESIVWPSKWPGLNDPSSIDRTKKVPHLNNNSSARHQEFARVERNIDSLMPYSVFIPGKDYAELLAFLKMQKKNGAILIDGRKMFAIPYLPMPCEEMWKRVSTENPIDEYQNTIFDMPEISGEDVDTLTPFLDK